MKLSIKILAVLVVTTLLVMAVSAQTGQGIISGKVIGRDGMPLAGAVIHIDRMNSQNAIQRIVAQRFDTKTGKNGGYSYNGLPPGSYNVTLDENGKPLMVKGDTPGDTITVADGREASGINFDMTKAPAPAAAAAAAGPPPSKADLDKERKEMEKIAANKATRDKAFKAGTEAYKQGAALKADPTKADAAKASFEEAATQFRTVVSVDPKQDVAWANLGNTLKELKQWDEAASSYQKAIELKPTEAAYANNLGLVLGGAGKLDEGKARFEDAAKLDPTKAGEYLFNAGAMYFNAGDFPKANAAFARTLEADPNNKSAMLQLAISYFGSTDTMSKAEPLLVKFLTLNPTPADKETAQGLLNALHEQLPTEYKSQKALDDEKKAADAKAAKDAQQQKGKAPAAGKANKD
jgi:tetratricopeptide (TPR) repeat protein